MKDERKHGEWKNDLIIENVKIDKIVKTYTREEWLQLL